MRGADRPCVNTHTHKRKLAERKGDDPSEQTIELQPGSLFSAMINSESEARLRV